jgi:molybdate transport system regulatory protein
MQLNATNPAATFASARAAVYAPDMEHATLWIKIDLGGRGQIGPGKIALLRRVRDDRSIAAAARAMGMSYRRAWLLIDQMNEACGRPVVRTRIGGHERGGAVLTEFGGRLIERYDAIVARARRSTASELDALIREVHQPSS